jgi:hypothetical protein
VVARAVQCVTRIPNAFGGDGADVGAFEGNFTLRITALTRLQTGNILIESEGVANALVIVRGERRYFRQLATRGRER